MSYPYSFKKKGGGAGSVKHTEHRESFKAIDLLLSSKEGGDIRGYLTYSENFGEWLNVRGAGRH